MEIDWESLTLDEVEQIETFAGLSIDKMMDDGVPRGRALKVLLWIMNKRKDPNYTIEQAGKLSLKDATALLGGGDTDPK
jgi:hypothetical protein